MSKPRYEHPGFEYDQVEVVTTIPLTANHWEAAGWDTVSVVSPHGTEGYSLLIRRVKVNPYNMLENADEFEKWSEWDTKYGGPWTHRRRA